LNSKDKYGGVLKIRWIRGLNICPPLVFMKGAIATYESIPVTNMPDNILQESLVVGANVGHVPFE